MGRNDFYPVLSRFWSRNRQGSSSGKHNSHTHRHTPAEAESSSDSSSCNNNYIANSSCYNYNAHNYNQGESIANTHNQQGERIVYSHNQEQRSSNRTHTYKGRELPTYIADNFTSYEEVTEALREAGLESSNLILGIDFTKSNEWTGKYSFNQRSLHSIISGDPNPYEQVISIIGRTLSPFDKDNLIPCFGFGDATTNDKHVFSFYPDHQPCNGFEEALARYRDTIPYIKLSGPTSFAPIIDAAIDIVVSSGQYHILVIIADGQVTRQPDLPPGRLSPQEQATLNSIVAASHYPLSIVLIGVGDGPWDGMHELDDNIPKRAFDNFQFVNFTKIMSENQDLSKKEAAFALAALMEIPFQYKATQNLKLSNKKVKGACTRPLPPPPGVIDHDNVLVAQLLDPQ